MQMQKSWKRCTGSDRQRLRRSTDGKDLFGFLGKIISQKDQKVGKRTRRRTVSYGSMKMIFNAPGKIIGKTISFQGKIKCRDCEEFDKPCVLGKHPDMWCPQIQYHMRVQEIAYRRGADGWIYIINKETILKECDLERVSLYD